MVDENVKRYYESDRVYQNLLSQWFPKIKDIPGLRIPGTKTIPVPIEVFAAFECDEVYKEMDAIKQFVESNIVPEMAGSPQWFMKNGCFSNKFDFRNCITNAEKVLADFIKIQYASACLETGGISEINIREVIPWDRRKTATIYHGMPLRTEIRVFYDFDRRKMLYSSNYWDYKYVAPHLHARTDKIIFDATRLELLAGYEVNRAQVENVIQEAMKEVDMTGRWSIDVLVETNDDSTAKENGLWLIDMAQAERSAYWKEEASDSL